MLAVLKSVGSFFTTALSDIPDGLRVILDFVWKVRWFIVVGFILFTLYTMVMKILPYLMWMWVIKSIFGSLSFLFI